MATKLMVARDKLEERLLLIVHHEMCEPFVLCSVALQHENELHDFINWKIGRSGHVLTAAKALLAVHDAPDAAPPVPPEIANSPWGIAWRKAFFDLREAVASTEAQEDDGA